MKKRKPPSQRPELMMDETARAIARLREDAKADKSPESGRSVVDGSRPRVRPSGQDFRHQRAGGVVAPSASTKRQKSGGG